MSNARHTAPQNLKSCLKPGTHDDQNWVVEQPKNVFEKSGFTSVAISVKTGFNSLSSVLRFHS